MEINNCINFLLTNAQHTVFLKMKNGLEKYDITPIQYAVLYFLWNEEDDTAKEIADKLHIENSTISGVLDRMDRKGLIVREVNPNDRRYTTIKLTEKASKLKEPILEIVEEVNKDVLKVFTDEKKDELKDMLRVLGGL